MVDEIQQVTTTEPPDAPPEAPPIPPADPSTDPKAVEAAVQAAAKTATAKSEDKSPATVKLFHPDYESLMYGPGGGNQQTDQLIVFGPKGGFEPNVWIGPKDHPLLEQLYVDHPNLVEVTDTPKVFVCGTCGREFGSYGAWAGHQRAHKGGAQKG